MRAALALSVSLALSVLAGSVLADTAVPDRRLALTRDVDYPGGDLQSLFDTTLRACEAACLADDRCLAFTFNTRSSACFTKSGIGEEAAYEGALSGRVQIGRAHV